ncbi:Smr/MutS family protein [Mycoplasma sp. CSL7491-lung]|uniref:Smr/MutS family protein n=1 Tax=Mycoplasma sp. CSL7491-lung TaxID=549718 RepID=UPI001C12866D|nr:Smr/MutS family protein [Mycoplasma sp. CSL7491-lung]MBU4692714.1 Smr/MutS family protein [Mycoplasma sp. CSL7491-lung]
MKNTIDIHGFTHEEALPKIQLKILELLNNKHDHIKIITGKGTGVLQNSVENFIIEHNKHDEIKLSYTVTNNGGTYIIRKNNDIEQDYCYEDDYYELDQEDIDSIFEQIDDWR